MAAKQNLELDQGQDWSQQLVWNDASNNPYNLVGWTARMDVRESAEADTVYATLTTEDGDITLDANGGILLELDHVATSAIPAGNWVYDLELVSPADEVTVLMRGHFKVIANVTRSEGV